MWFDSPVKLGERVTMKGTYVEAYERRGQGYVVMEAQATGEDGRSIVRHRGVEILRTVPGKIAGRGSATPEKRVTGEVSASARRIENDHARRARGRRARARRSRPSRRSRRRCFAHRRVRAQHHNDLRIARAGEVADAVRAGQQQGGFIGEKMVTAFGASFFTDGWFRVKFVSPLQVFDPIETVGRRHGRDRCARGRLKVELEVWARRASDQRLTTDGSGGPSGIVRLTIHVRRA
ncbi:hypothetical protein L0Z14_30320 [Burkholderia multivorans]|uniref:hypothetical protein n=1 Tax=Burkholderia multivorans TaxID=87883 RepID=UPI00201A538B|nr:hypothetical protein [Burkholderia multivorans]MCL4665195.1 hypothetical protein [Burkholderia multivorans]